MDWHPGDRALDFALIVALGVTLLSGAAWVVSSRLPRKPATRHLVLLSALDLLPGDAGPGVGLYRVGIDADLDPASAGRAERDAG